MLVFYIQDWNIDYLRRKLFWSATNAIKTYGGGEIHQVF